MSVKLHYYRTINFGDALSRKLVEYLSGNDVVYAHPRSANLIAVGSVLFSGGALFVGKRDVLTPVGLMKMGRKLLDCLMPTLNIWGSGFLVDPGVCDVIKIRNTSVCAVRGKLTLKVLVNMGFLNSCNDHCVALGDPGLLYPMLLDENHPVSHGKWEIGVVPHFRDIEAGRCFAHRLAGEGRSVRLIDVCNPDPLQTVAEIGSCKEIRSSSLHGLVVADAFGIPNEHVKFSNLGQESGDVRFKFEDYYSAWCDSAPSGLHVMPRDVYSRIKGDLLGSFPYAKK